MLYPKGSVEGVLRDSAELKRRVWKVLNEICPEVMLGEDRVYGDGLHELEPLDTSRAGQYADHGNCEAATGEGAAAGGEAELAVRPSGRMECEGN